MKAVEHIQKKPGRMTAVMRAASLDSAAPKVLRVGVVERGMVIFEQVVERDAKFTIGPSEEASFVIASRSVPRSFALIEVVNGNYRLNLLDGMVGRIVTDGGVELIEQLRAQGRTHIQLNDRSRGRVSVGETTFLLQALAPLPRRPKPQLPSAATRGLFGSVDWFTTIVAAFSFLLHFLVVASIYGDWMDPIVDDDLNIGRIVEVSSQLPAPPPLETATPTSPETGGPKPKDKGSTTNKPKATPGSVNRPGGNRHASGSRTGSNPSPIARVDDLSAQLDGLDTEVLGVIDKNRPASDTVIGNPEVPAILLDEAGRDSRGTRIGLNPIANNGDQPIDDSNRPFSTPGDRDKCSDCEGNPGTPGGPDDPGTPDGPDGPDNPPGDPAKPPKKPTKLPGAGAVIAGLKGRFRSCYQGGMAVNPDLAGSTTLILKVAPSGSVSSVGGGGGSLAPIAGCLRAVASGAKFAPSKTGATVVVPVRFHHI